MLFILPFLGGLISNVPFKLLRTLKYPFQVKDFFSTAVDMRRTAAAAARWRTTENLNTLVFDGWPQKFPTRCCLSSLFLTKPPICGGVARFFYKFPTTLCRVVREKEMTCISRDSRVALSTRTFWRTLYQLSYRAGANSPAHFKNDAAFFLQCIIVKKLIKAALLKPSDPAI